MTGIAVKKQDGNSLALPAAPANKVSRDVEPWEKPFPRGLRFESSKIGRFRIIDEFPLQGVGKNRDRSQQNQ